MDAVPVRLSLRDADALAARLHGDGRTRLGGLHIDHARRVCFAAGDASPQILVAALLHDVIEQGAISLGELGTLVGDPRAVELVGVLSKRCGESELDYLARCAADPDALRLKRLDLIDKLVAEDATVDPERADEVRAEAQRRLALLDALAGPPPDDPPPPAAPHR